LRENVTGEAVHEEGSRPSVNRMVIAILSVLGLSVSLYMWAYAAGLTGPVLCGIGDCEAVQNSEFSRIGGVPVAALGVAGYLALLLSALAGLQPGWQTSRKISWLLFGGSLVGLAFSAYLTYLEAFVIYAWCQWCVSSAIIMALAFGASIPELKRGRIGT
jgi:uncharacterized membrane protein